VAEFIGSDLVEELNCSVDDGVKLIEFIDAIRMPVWNSWLTTCIENSAIAHDTLRRLRRDSTADFNFPKELEQAPLRCWGDIDQLGELYRGAVKFADTLNAVVNKNPILEEILEWGFKPPNAKYWFKSEHYSEATCAGSMFAILRFPALTLTGISGQAQQEIESQLALLESDSFADVVTAVRFFQECGSSVSPLELSSTCRRDDIEGRLMYEVTQLRLIDAGSPFRLPPLPAIDEWIVPEQFRTASTEHSIPGTTKKKAEYEDYARMRTALAERLKRKPKSREELAELRLTCSFENDIVPLWRREFERTTN